MMVLGMLVLSWGPARAQDLLEPGQAFQVEARMISSESLEITWRIAKHHYMYRQRFFVRAVGGDVTLGEPRFPAGKKKQDEFFGEMEVYDSDVTFTVPVDSASADADRFVIEAAGQGCNEPVGVCYPPVMKSVTLRLPALQSAVQPSSSPQSSIASSTLDSLKALVDGGSNQSEFLHRSGRSRSPSD